MLAGTVKVIGGTLVGDGANNAVVIHQVASPPNSGASISLQIEGIGTNLLLAKPQNVTGPPTDFFPPTKSLVISGIFDLNVSLGGGNDLLTIYNTSIYGTYKIDMGSGNDKLSMTNVQNTFAGFIPPPGALTITVPSEDVFQLGSGDDTAVFNNVRAAVDFQVFAGDDRDAVFLNRVTAGIVDSVFPTGRIIMEMGPGNSDVLTAISCTADVALFRDSGGVNGLLLRFQNQFGSQTDSGFSFPF
jgi:hypothetical protein